MKSLLERAEKVVVEVSVPIPSLDGDRVQETVKVKIQALKDPVTGEVFYDGAALEELDRVKARYMGLMSPVDIHELRQSLCLTQKSMSRLLQIGEKTYTRWEIGRERPSRSLNILLRALGDGYLTVAYLASLHHRVFDWRDHMAWQGAESLFSKCRRPNLIAPSEDKDKEYYCASFGAAA